MRADEQMIEVTPTQLADAERDARTQAAAAISAAHWRDRATLSARALEIADRIRRGETDNAEAARWVRDLANDIASNAQRRKAGEL